MVTTSVQEHDLIDLYRKWSASHRGLRNAVESFISKDNPSEKVKESKLGQYVATTFFLRQVWDKIESLKNENTNWLSCIDDDAANCGSDDGYVLESREGFNKRVSSYQRFDDFIHELKDGYSKLWCFAAGEVETQALGDSNLRWGPMTPKELLDSVKAGRGFRQLSTLREYALSGVKTVTDLFCSGAIEIVGAMELSKGSLNNNDAAKLKENLSTLKIILTPLAMMPGSLGRAVLSGFFSSGESFWKVNLDTSGELKISIADKPKRALLDSYNIDLKDSHGCPALAAHVNGTNLVAAVMDRMTYLMCEGLAEWGTKSPQ